MNVPHLLVAVEFVVLIAFIRPCVVLDLSVFVFRFVLIELLLLHFQIVSFGFDFLVLLWVPELTAAYMK